MSARYAPIPNPQYDPLLRNEMEAAFDDPDDEDDEPIARSETRPLNPATPSPNTPATGAYDFENFDYANFPPPGSPPEPTASAVPNSIGNSNGLIPSTSDIEPVQGPRTTWLRRAAVRVLPRSYVRQWGLDYERPTGYVGGGTGNDGVFANVTAKPSRPLEIREGDEIYLVPEEAQKDVPPSYASAQLDAVPPYWETTVHAPSSPDAFGEMIIDALPTGSIFSFLWNLLISISFQFVGFLLTYLLHTTHAARFGSRAGLGITLIQYGFALRARGDDEPSGGGWFGMGYGQVTQGDPLPTFATKEEAEAYYRGLNITMVNGQPTGPILTPSPISNATLDEVAYVSDATTDWLSFFLMTIGWFILLTSILGFWRVKRWERNILASHQSAPSAPAPERRARGGFGMLGIPMRDMSGMLRAGLGFSRRRGDEEGGDVTSPAVVTDVRELTAEEHIVPATTQAQLSELDQVDQRELLLAMYAHDPARQRQLRQAFRDDDRLMETMREAGML